MCAGVLHALLGISNKIISSFRQLLYSLYFKSYDGISRKSDRRMIVTTFCVASGKTGKAEGMSL